jgi:methionyl-tRNA synthetase
VRDPSPWPCCGSPAHSELADTLGNLASRACAASIVPARVVPPPQPARWTARDAEFAAAVARLPADVRLLYADAEFGRGADAVLGVLRAGNAYFAEMEPWRLRKTDPARAADVVALTVEALRVAALALLPVMPDAMSRLLAHIGASAAAATALGVAHRHTQE